MKLTLQVLSVSFLGIAAQSFCMELELPYPQKCAMIDLYNENKLNKFITEISVTNGNTAESRIKVKLEQLQYEIEVRKNQVLIAIKDRHDISDGVWGLCTDMAKKLDDFEEKDKYIGLPDFYHDKNMPLDIVLMLKNNLIDRRINPERFDIKIGQDLQGTCPSYACGFSKDNITILAVEPGSFVIDRESIKDSYHAKEALCIALVTGISSETRYYNTCLSLLSIMHSLFDVKKVNITQEEISCFGQSIFNLSMLIFALKNKDKVHIIKTYYNQRPLLGFTFDDYEVLSKIDRLHRSLAWLQEYMPCDREKPLLINNSEII